jgi:hypothetical protein
MPPAAHRTLPVVDGRDATVVAPLIDATEEYVGPPQMAEPPYRASAFEREVTLIKQPPPWLPAEPGTVAPDVAASWRPPVTRLAPPPGPPAAALRGGPLLVPPTEDHQLEASTEPAPVTTPVGFATPGRSDMPIVPGPAIPPGPATPPSAPAPRSMTRPPLGPPPPAGTTPRATLAQSRRLGLGAPLRPPAASTTEPGPTPQAESRESPESTQTRDAALSDHSPTDETPPEPLLPPAAIPFERSVEPTDAEAAGPAPAPPSALPDGGSRGRVSDGVHTQPVPTEIATLFRSVSGVDVPDVPIHRGPAVTSQAAALGARAFTRGGAVFLPDAAGPLDHTTTRALLVHELTHVAQQRRLGTVPAESSAAGAALEHAAIMPARRAMRAQPPRLVHAPAIPVLAATTDVTTRTQRDPLEDLLAAPGTDPAEAAGEAAPEAITTAPAIAAPLAYSGAPMLLSSGTVPPGTDQAVPVAAAASEDVLALLAHRERLTALCEERPVDLDDPISLDELATKLFARLRRLLRSDLLIDRERAGLLADAG